jgi:hypothetical protein
MSIVLIWLGALLVTVGVVYTAAQALWRGRLSTAKPPHQGLASDTLEPPQPAGGFGLKANWPGLALIALGALLLLIGAAA